MADELPAVVVDGVPRVLGVLPPHEVPPWPPLAAARPPLPRSEWQEFDLASVYRPRQLDQGRSNSCVGHASATVAEVCWTQRGTPRVAFTPFFIYAQINRDQDQGAVISDASEAMARVGIAPAGTMPERVYFRRDIPPQVYEAAAKYRLERWHHCPTWDEIGTALSLGWPVVVGILVGNNVVRLTDAGTVPIPDTVVGGHAIALVGLRRVGGVHVAVMQNSWGVRWGRQGFGYVTEELIDYSARRWGGRIDAWCCESLSGPDDAPVARESA